MLRTFFSRLKTPNSDPKKTGHSREAVIQASEAKPVRLDERIKIGIARVLAEAWSAVPNDMPAAARFQAAKSAAAQSITRLSPSIKRQVGAHFQTQKWEPLRMADPLKDDL